MSDTIQCYFFGTTFGNENPAERRAGLAGFAIPDLGIIFRSQWKGNLYEIQYAGLLSLLKFIEANSKSFKEFEFEILSDSAIVVYQIAQRKFISPELDPFLRAALAFKSKIPYKVSWVPRHENIAITGLNDVPPITPDVQIDFEKTIPDPFKESRLRRDSREP